MVKRMEKISIQNRIIDSISTLNDFCKYETFTNAQTGSLRLEIEPLSNMGSENISVLILNDHITVSYDYFEKRFELSSLTLEENIENIKTLIKNILRENLIAVTTYSININTSKVSNLYEPSEGRKIFVRDHGAAHLMMTTIKNRLTWR